MASNNPFVDLLVEAYEKIAIAKYIAVVALAFYVYDFLITFDSEVKCWSILVLCIYMPTIFSHGVDVKLSDGYNVLRRWCDLFVPQHDRGYVNESLDIIQPQHICVDLREMIQIPNPAPELITGCLTILPKIVTQVPYVISLTLDTAIFSATLWKTLALNRSGVRLPIIKCLMRDGTVYYLINCASLAAALLLSIDSNLNNIALGSGYIIALHSTLCTRILLSLHVFNERASGNVTHLNGTTAKDVEWSSGNLKTATGNVTTQRPDSPLELEVMKRHD